MKLHNTASKKLETFTPVDESVVTMYSCGPTVYSFPHVGNWFGYVHWDVLVRLLMHSGYEVRRTINITDVGHLTGDNDGDADSGEDKLEKSARLEHKSAHDIANFYTDNFLAGFSALNMIQPTRFARATNYIEQQLELVRILKEKGYTYQIDDGIYFDTAKFSRYADFAGLQLNEQKAGARVEVNDQKHSQSDFALWKFSPEDVRRDMEWETPADLLEEPQDAIVMGFPGWHLECSAIIMSTLGDSIDIHTGGIDHIPVHHTNEIAQSETATGQTLAHTWLHNNHMKADGTKISKSLGNGYTLEDLAEKGFSALDYRMLALQSHYQSESNFSFDSLQAAKNRLLAWRNIAALRHQTHDTLDNDDEKDLHDGSVSLLASSQALIETLSNNIDTPGALALIDQAFDSIVAKPLGKIHHAALVAFLEVVDDTLGLDLLGSSPDIDDDTKQAIITRRRAREAGDWKESDKARDKIAKKGIALRDTKHDTIWSYIS